MDEYDSESSEDCEELLKKAIDVVLPDDFDPNSIPQNGEEYLHHVIYERSKCRKLVTARIDTKKFVNKQTFKIDEDVISRPKHVNIPLDWQLKAIKNFKDFRNFLLQYMENERSSKDFSKSGFIEKVDREEPNYYDIIHINEHSKVSMIKLISSHLDHIPKGSTISSTCSVWIFALLSLLDIPLAPDSCFVLRELAKRCIKIRTNLGDNSGIKYDNLNLFICIIARFYNQIDLADE